MDDFESHAAAFSKQIEAELAERRLTFPTSLDVSLRIKRLADDPDSSLEDIAALVRAEPVLSAKAVRMANAVAMNPYGGQVTGVNDAVRRIGLSALRCLAFSVAAEQLAQDHRSPAMRLVASGLWMHSVDVAAWAGALARHLKVANPDTAMLSGMMVDIGQFFLLARAADHPALAGDMDRFAELVATWNEPVGRAILEAFDLPEEILDAFAYENPYGGAWPPGDLSDIVFIATVAAETPNPFDTLRGLARHPELADCAPQGIDPEALAALLASVTTQREQILAAVRG